MPFKTQGYVIGAETEEEEEIMFSTELSQRENTSEYFTCSHSKAVGTKQSHHVPVTTTCFLVGEGA